jgi:hypothetical protein
MHTITALLATVLATSTLAACEKSGDKAPASQPPQAAAPADATLAPKPNPAIEFMNTLASAIETNTGDCDKMAAAVDRVFADNARFVTLIEEMRNADDKTRDKLASSSAHKEFQDSHGSAKNPLLARIAGADPCMAKHAGLAAALGRLGKRPAKASP